LKSSGRRKTMKMNSDILSEVSTALRSREEPRSFYRLKTGRKL
jgi:hypothetical protein